ncbi:hypothetical protein PVK06_027978 [Gossypium arboreum]|uniref:Reverse transcriptase n=1 Tax=Gossypium arboreum TaxID=29729 RepID=A0ABR0P1U1_GOSAR|nr:hypothetical protein PVK06_027978 [Gossypium arboreum]
MGVILRNTIDEVRKSKERFEFLGREYSTSQRRRKNWIHKLQNDKGRETEALNEIEAVARSYFYNLFTARNRGNYDYVLTGINCCVSEGDNEKLTTTYTNEKIQEAVFEMGAIKAPGEDGFPALFYQKCWHIIGYEVAFFCLQILSGDMEVSSLNHTNIVFISKKCKPINVAFSSN